MQKSLTFQKILCAINHKLWSLNNWIDIKYFVPSPTCGRIDRAKWFGKEKSFWLLIFRYTRHDSPASQPVPAIFLRNFPSRYLFRGDECEVAKFVGHNWCLVKGNRNRMEGDSIETKTAMEKFRQDSALPSTKSIAAEPFRYAERVIRESNGYPVFGNK